MRYTRSSHCQRFVIGSLLLLLCTQPSQADKSDLLYDPEHVLDVKIEMPERDWNELCGQTRSMVASLGKQPAESPFGYFRCRVTLDGKTLEYAGIRKKGFLGSLDSNRPSLKLNLDKSVEAHEFRDVDSITRSRS